jgi:hypothetical protein
MIIKYMKFRVNNSKMYTYNHPLYLNKPIYYSNGSNGPNRPNNNLIIICSILFGIYICKKL